MKKRVVVAMSGGVDSAVAASILQDQGYDVVGITMQLWPKKEADGEKPLCCGIEAIDNAGRVAGQLGIPHYVVDFRDIFKNKVIKDFCAEYAKGRTPNPCIKCNQHIKFDVLLKKALALGADKIATGHYARVVFNKSKKRYVIRKALHEKNDQSYVLYTLKQEQLEHIIFPLGEMIKKEVREYARKKGLFNSERESSQEICFTGTKDYRDFLVKYIKDDIKSGPIVTINGDVIGKHKGLPFYTIGQREGLGISHTHALYVIEIDKKSNRLIVGSNDDVYSSRCEVRDTNFILDNDFEESFSAKVKIRYQHEPGDAEIMPLSSKKCRILFKKPQRAVTPGQAAVFYDDDTIIGGGIISKTVKNGY